jgi:hypothetical protein
MSRSYRAGNNPPIDYPSILVRDLNPTPLAAGQSEAQSLISSPIPYYRVAAIMLQSLASMQAWPSGLAPHSEAWFAY